MTKTKPTLEDSNIDWTGGMDTSRPPYLIEADKYYRGCNVRIPRFTGRLKNRHGIRAITLVGNDEDICRYKCCKNYQAEGKYVIGKEVILLRLVDGWILEFRKVTEHVYSVKTLNPNDRRGHSISKGWITTIPNGAIVNDGQGLPHIIKSNSIRRSDPSKNEIDVGTMGVYLQNRFFYVKPNLRYIIAGDFNSPETIENSINTNIYGFLLPEDDAEITAIGRRKQKLNYVEGGTLSFSTATSTYSVDVRGDRQSWELAETGLGKVQESIPDIGAISSYSYEPFSSNLYFRTMNDGIMDLRTSEYQFQNSLDYSSQSIEVSNWLDLDTKNLLSKCYTRKYGHRLLTTVAPEISDHGYVYWNGLISMIPDPIYRSQRIPTVYEGLITGVRPWGMTSFDSPSYGDKFFIDSYDVDGVTRLYAFDRSIDYDIDHNGRQREIESWVETRGYHFGSFPSAKDVSMRYYSLVDIPRSLNVKGYSRTECEGEWVNFFDIKHKIPRSSTKTNNGRDFIFSPSGSSPQSRNKFNLPDEKENDILPNGSLPISLFHTIQYRFNFSGAFTLSHFSATATTENESVNNSKEDSSKSILRDKIKDYTYKISNE